MQTMLETFKEFTQARTEYPLRMGAYKLREARHNIERMCRDIDEVLRYYRRLNDGQGFDSLTVEDLPYGFRKFPNHLIHELAYNILPAIKALDVDGANKGKIEQHLSTAKPKLIQILEDAQELHDLLCAGGKRSYERQTLRIGFMFAKLVEKIVSIVDQARLLLPPDSSIGTANKISIQGHLKPIA